MGGGGDEQQGPSYTTSSEGRAIRSDANPIVYPTGYTSFDRGDSYQEDPNTHFKDQYGAAWYVDAGADLNNKSAWKSDTMQGYHMSRAEMSQRNEAAAAEEQAQEDRQLARYQWDQMFSLQKDQAAAANAARQQQLSLLAEEKAATEAAQKAQAAKDLIFKQRALRFASGRAAGRSGTIRTGSLGLSGVDLDLGRATLLGGNASA